MKIDQKWLFIVGLVFGFAGCGGGGDNAPDDAVVTAPSSQIITVPAPGGGTVIYRDLVFHVKNSAGEPVPGVQIDFLGSGFLAEAELSDRNGNLLDKNSPDYYKTNTDESGVAQVSLLMTLPTSGREDVKTIGSVTANVGSASALFTAEVTVRAAPAPTPTPTPTP